MKNKLLRGIPASPGIEMAKAVIYGFTEKLKVALPKSKETTKRKKGEESFEIRKLEAAIEKTRHEIELIRNDFMSRTDDYHARIFDAQLLVIEDKILVNRTINKISKNNLTAEYAFKITVSEILSEFEKVKDEYIKARVADIKDVTNRVLHNLTTESTYELPLLQNEKHIVIAQDLSPSDTARFKKEIVSGFATDLGGGTSHTAIMARALGIPAVVGLGDVTKFVSSGDEVIIDGNRGIVLIEPDESTRRVYEDKMHRFQQYEKELFSLVSLPCRTLDGYTVELACNIELPEEIDAALSHGADAIGLLRTEFLYLKSDKLPTEYEQFGIYKSLAQKVSSLTIRTLDLGGDKLPPVLQTTFGGGIGHGGEAIHKELSSRGSRVLKGVPMSIGMPLIVEANPALGWRGIRFSLARRNIFISQLKAIIRANYRGNIKILLPMVQNLEEVRLAKACINEVAEKLMKSGIPYGKNIEIGVMIEIPSAAIIAHAIAEEVDFLSIGSNDLTQYTLACDRTNPMVSQIYNPLHPAVLKLIKYTIEASHKARKWVSLCGEFASYPPAIPILVGLGMDELSVAPIYLLEVKKIIRSLSINEARVIASEVSRFDNENDVKRYIENIRDRFPVIKEITAEREGPSK